MISFNIFACGYRDIMYFRKLILLILLGLISPELYAQEYVVAKVAKGEGVYSMLRKYKLDQYSCNLKEFYRLNNLSPNASLILGKDYKMPIRRYTYNAKSIRTTINNSDLPRARMIEQYNKDLLFAKIKEVYFIQDKDLWVPYHIFQCSDPAKTTIMSNPFPDDGKTQENPTLILSKPTDEPIYSGKEVNYPLFGAKYSRVPLKDESLKNKVFYLKGGHGGPDPGAMSRIEGNVCCEDEYAYDVALRLGRLLVMRGAKVHFIVTDPNDGIRDDQYLICDKDERQGKNEDIPLNQILRLRGRINYVNSMYNTYKKQGITDQKFISIHVDSRSENVSLDVHFYYFEGSDAGMRMALNTQETFSTETRKTSDAAYTGTVKGRDLYVLKYSHPPALFVEIGNIQNPNDQKRLIESSYRQLISSWLFEGITKSK